MGLWVTKKLAAIEKFIHRSYVSKPKYIEIMAGVPEDYSQIKTLGDLLGINYKHVTVERQLRGNLIAKLKNHDYPYPGILGYNEDVIPAVNRAYSFCRADWTGKN